MSMLDKADAALAVFIERFGIKLLLIVLSTILLCVDKIDQSNWVITVLTVAGFRTFNQAVSIYKNSKETAVEPKEEVPDEKL